MCQSHAEWVVTLVTPVSLLQSRCNNSNYTSYYYTTIGHFSGAEFWDRQVLIVIK